MRTAPPRPVVVVSGCLELDPCRYNAQTIRAPLVLALRPHARLRAVCPELEIGLGVPRDPIKLVTSAGGARLVQPSSGRDLTDRMTAFSDRFLASLGDADGFILKSRSPSCGIEDTKRYADEAATQPVGKGPGMFGAAVLRRFPYAAIEDEERLTDPDVRYHFLTKLFTRAAFREVRSRATLAGLVAFHAANELLLAAYDQTALRRLTEIVASAGGNAPDAVLAAYEAHLGSALARPAGRASHADVLIRAVGRFSRRLARHETAQLLDDVAAYREERISLTAPIAAVQSWITRFAEPYLSGQTYFEPYPAALRDLDHHPREP